MPESSRQDQNKRRRLWDLNRKSSLILSSDVILRADYSSYRAKSRHCTVSSNDIGGHPNTPNCASCEGIRPCLSNNPIILGENKKLDASSFSRAQAKTATSQVPADISHTHLDTTTSTSPSTSGYDFFRDFQD